MVPDSSPPSLTWRPLNFSSGLSTRGRLRRGIPTVASGRCRGRGGGAARWVGWKLLITHVTLVENAFVSTGLSDFFLANADLTALSPPPLTRKAAMAPPVMNPARTSFQWFLCSVTRITPTNMARESRARHRVGLVKRVPLARNIRVMYICGRRRGKKHGNNPQEVRLCLVLVPEGLTGFETATIHLKGCSGRECGPWSNAS